MEPAERYVLALDGKGLATSDVGSKAATLDFLYGHGFPVPATVVVAADAYREFIGTGVLDALLEDLRDGGIPVPDAIGAETERIEREFGRAPIPETMAARIKDGVAPLLALGPVAVRSTATAEDLATASFAGQYHTYLDVASMEEVFTAIRNCWASLWLAPARAYRDRHGIGDDDLAMAVMVQTLVPADWSGVIFTRDPEGSSGDMRIEAVAGLGESLVSGSVTPYDYTVDRRLLTVRSEAGHPSLEFLEDLARIGLRVEYYLDTPQDIEWAYCEGQITLLQSRPITVVRPLAIDDDGFNTRFDGTDTYTPRGLAEMLPGVVPPLLWSISSPALEEAFRRLFDSLGVGRPGTFRTPIGRCAGRAVLNLSVLRDVAAELPGGSAAEVEYQYLGRAVSPQDDTAVGFRPGALVRNWRVRRRISEDVAVFVRAVEEIVALEIDPGILTADRLLAYRARLRDLAWRGYAAEVAVASAAGAAYRALEMLLSRWVGPDDAEEWAQRLTTGTIASAAVGTRRLAVLAEIYERYRRDIPELEGVLRGVSPGRARVAIASLGDRGRAFLREVDRAVRRFGSAAIYAGPTWEEDDRAVWTQFAGLTRSPPRSGSDEGAAAMRQLIEMLRGSGTWRLIRTLTGQFVDIRQRMLRKLVEDTSLFLRLREQAKGQLLVLGGEERRVIREIGGRLVRAGHLHEPGDEVYLSDTELEAMLMGHELALATEVERRKRAAIQYRQTGPLPDLFADIREHGATAAGDLAVLEGWAAGPGVATGRSRIVHDPAAAGGLADGDILVAHATDPSWTPLFLVAGGLVLEEGGPLSHAAIVAREFGLPAVLNVADAARIIEEGERVEVDGTAGVVRRLEEEGS